MLWGASLANEIVKPTFHMRFNVSPYMFKICGKFHNTVLFNIGNVSFWMYKLKQEAIDELMTNGDIILDCIVSLETNEWDGEVTPKAIVKQYEIVKAPTMEVYYTE